MTTRTPISIFLGTLALLWAAVPLLAQRGGRGGTPPLPQNLAFRFMGPAAGNRIAAASGVVGDPNTYYAGAASGGVWKSTDKGATWKPVFDAMPVQAIGALAVSRSDPKQVWAGTGEAWAIRDSDMMGDGIYKSTDAGATWQHMGLEETGRIGRIVVHPTDANVVYACALGRTTGPQQERGVFKTTDGGRNWTRVLFVDPNTGCSGLNIDENDPNTLFAGMWQVEMHTYAMFSGGPSSGIYVTHDGGAHWTHLEGSGLPHAPLGKIDIAPAPSNSKRVYALIQTADQGSIWRSDDGGQNWSSGSWQRELIGRAGYYIKLAINPKNPDEVFVANSSFWHSVDGGKSFTTLPWGGDTHDIWIDPTDPNRILMTHDGGMYMTTDHGQTSNRVTLPIGQMYHVAIDNDVPYHIYSNMQDNSTMRGLSTTQEAGANVPGQNVAGRGGRGGFGGGRGGFGGRDAVGTWEHGLGGCESGFTLPDPTNSDIIWASCYGNEVTRYDARTHVARSISPWLHTLDSQPDKAKYRCHWTPPLATDPFDHNAVYYGCQVIFRTTNGGQSWSVVSEDLSTRDPKYVVSSGGIVGDNLGQFYGEVVFSIAPSEIQRGLVWAGTNDGKVWYTRDSLSSTPHWTDVTKNIPGLPPMAVISKIEPSHFDPATAYICADLHLAENRDPWIYKTTDFGKTWTKITGNLPIGHPLDYARAVAESPNRKGMLFAGTGNALFYSLDDGGTWEPLQEGLPHAPVTWIVVQKASHDLVVSTYGRGIYIMHDITPLEQGVMEPSFSEPVSLVAPRTVFREPRGANAEISFKLAAAPQSPVELDVVDSKGAEVAKLPPVTGHAGLNRIAAEIRYAPPRLVALRTTPPENPHIWEEPRFRGQDTRPITHWGIAQAEVGPIAAPGNYTLKMTVDGRTFTQPLHIAVPPGAHGTEADEQAAVKLQLKIRDDISTVSDMTNQLEWMRKQLEDQEKSVQGREGLLKAMADMDGKLKAVELKLVTESDMLSDDKYYPEKYQLYLNLIWLNGEIGTGAGDVAGTGDYGPTETDTALVLDLERQLDSVKTDYSSVIEKDVAAYNRTAGAAGVEPLKTTGAPPAPVRAGRGGYE
jgi:photosystem II stability/assembly factor-like uncharacterized protein